MRSSVAFNTGSSRLAAPAPEPQLDLLSPLAAVAPPGTMLAPLNIAVTPFNSELAAALDQACQVLHHYTPCSVVHQLQ